MQEKFHISPSCFPLFRKHGKRLNRRVFTYIDSDSVAFIDSIEHDVTTNETEAENILVQRMELLKYTNFKGRLGMQNNLRMRRNIVNDKPGENFKTNHVITTPNKLMHIMADLGSVDSNGIRIEDERILCVVKVSSKFYFSSLHNMQAMNFGTWSI